jgi:TolA-binding protein
LIIMRVASVVAGLCIALASTVSLRADTVWIGGLQIADAHILKIDKGNLIFTTSGRETSRELSKITRLSIDGETVFNSAEEAFSQGKWDDAADGYQRAIRATQAADKQWLKDYSTLRLLDAANKSGRFDAAVTAYVQLLLRNPATAAKSRPTMPDEKSTYLDSAATDVSNALKDSRLTDEQQIALLTFLIDIQNTRKDSKAADQTSAKLDEVLARNPNDPNAGRALARRKLQSASAALDTKNYAKAISDINDSRSLFTDPTQQADALYIVAEATFGQADKNNPTALKDAALAYMRVVAFFKTEPGHRRVPESLLKTAQIHELLNDTATAAEIYRQLAASYPADPAAAEANRSLKRLANEAPPQSNASDAR